MRLCASLMVLALAPLAVARSAVAQGVAEPPTLCRPDEQVVFACPTGQRVVSICARDAAAGLQYRFGRPGAVELSYPAEGRKGDFRLGALMFSGGGGAWLRFDNGGYRYTTFTATGKWGRAGGVAGAAGVAVTKAGKPVADLVCRSPPTSRLGPGLAGHAGVTRASPGEDFEIPDRFLPASAR